MRIGQLRTRKGESVELFATSDLVGPSVLKQAVRYKKERRGKNWRAPVAHRSVAETRLYSFSLQRRHRLPVFLVMSSDVLIEEFEVLIILFHIMFDANTSAQGSRVNLP